MPHQKTVRLSASEAALAFFTSMEDDHIAQRQAEQLVRGADAAAVRRLAFANSGSLIGDAIKDRIAYSDTTDDLYVKPDLLRQAISELASITNAAGGEARRLGSHIAAERDLGKEPEPGQQAKLAAVSEMEQHAGVILALASGALLQAPAQED